MVIKLLKFNNRVLTVGMENTHIHKLDHKSKDLTLIFVIIVKKWYDSGGKKVALYLSFTIYEVGYCMSNKRTV